MADGRGPAGARWVLALASLGSFLVVLDLGASVEEVEWTVNTY